MASGNKIVFKPSIELLRYYIYENDKFMKGTIDNPYIYGSAQIGLILVIQLHLWYRR